MTDMKNNIFKWMLISLVILSIASCSKKLDLLPTNDITAEQVYATPEGYKQALAKVYGSMATTGNKGPDGVKDIQGIDEGTSDFFRLFWSAQELTTDEAVVAWGDAGLPDLHNMNWTSNNPYLKGIYYRSMYQITLCNDFIRQCADDKLSDRGIGGTEADNIRKYKTEARFLRAFQYWVLMDLFANPPFVTEADAIGGAPPQQIKRTDLFAWLETELKAIETDLLAPRTNEYGRADRGAAWALLARMYLNAAVYTGTEKYTDAITYSKKVIDGGYALEDNYRHLLLADNYLNTNEFILTVNYDGNKTQSYGGSTFLLNGALGGNMVSTDYGSSQKWGGLRTTKNLPLLFPDFNGNADKRALFYTNGQSLEINNIGTFTDGFAVPKFVNKTRGGNAGSNISFSDVDIPLFRLAEMYLIYAEAVSRGGAGGDNATALGYLNLLRTRAYGNNNGQVNNYTADFILDERARELYWEGCRRTDLVRYDKFTTGNYLWPWKGGVKEGTAVDNHLNIFPLPASDVVANPNLKQNPGY